ncbi:hypothetical protein QVD17_06002 [Tagetes erecta]|uniref:J domain-containing protein n=1 Tax=Tagetes erecta TaxID=13708 RepID=A0AAD8PBX0_TARER|nr:hypothetical protein QVD17_06002 [Tagetes erecta]
MIGTLTTFAAGIGIGNSVRSPPTSTRSTSKTVSVKSMLHDVVERPESLYEVLRIEKNATITEIKRAYRRLAKIYHPDACDCDVHGDREFIEIHNAYATLSDPATRAIYDLKSSGGIRRKSEMYTAVGKKQGFYTCRRWETDQCW